MTYFFKNLGGAAAGTKKTASHGAPKIVRAGFEDSVEDDNASSQGRPQAPQSEASLSTVGVSMESGVSIASSDSHPQSDNIPMEELRGVHMNWGELACKELRNVIESEEGWQVWEDKKGLKIEKKTNEHGRFVGKGEMRWTVPLKSEARSLAEGEIDGLLYDFDFIEKFLWDDKTKSQYDEFTERMLVMHDHENVDCHVVDQIFKGRFGISGRDFVVTLMKKRDDDEKFERLLIGAQSVPPWHIDQIERLVKEEKVDEYRSLQEKVVRGFVYAAGFLLEHERGSNHFRIVYLNDADVKSRGVPQWIVNRVKLDQLKIVSYIPDCLLKAALTSPCAEND